MTVVRWEPARLLSSFFDTTTLAAPAPVAGPRRWVPPTDLVETADHFVLRVDLPGLGEGDVAIEVEDRVLRISGERQAEHESRDEGYVRIERATGSFARTLQLPEGVDADAIAATFDRGVLEVRVPKPEARKPRRVEIQVGESPKQIDA